LANFVVIQTRLSRRFDLAVDSLGLRQSGSSSQFIDPPQDFPKQVPGHSDFGQLERDLVGSKNSNLLSDPDFTTEMLADQRAGRVR
jgi:hypothetical protein